MTLELHCRIQSISRTARGVALMKKISPTIHFDARCFTPCQPVASLLEAVAEAARNATSGDVALLSPACSGLDQFRNYQHRGQMFCQAVKSIGGGELAPNPHMHGYAVAAL
jgi:UDP-N-acetylmuramoylalanine--D-glutamate ligase